MVNLSPHPQTHINNNNIDKIINFTIPPHTTQLKHNYTAYNHTMPNIKIDHMQTNQLWILNHMWSSYIHRKGSHACTHLLITIIIIIIIIIINIIQNGLIVIHVNLWYISCVSVCVCMCGTSNDYYHRHFCFTDNTHISQK